MSLIINQTEEPDCVKNEEDIVLTMIKELNEMSTEIKNMEEEFLSYHNYYDSTPKYSWSKDDHWKITFGYFKCAMRIYMLTQKTSCYNYPNEKIKTVELAEKKKTYYQTKRHHVWNALDDIKRIPKIKNYIDHMYRQNNKKIIEESVQEQVSLSESMSVSAPIVHVLENIEHEQDIQNTQDICDHV